MRTATDAFNMDEETSYPEYDFKYDGDKNAWQNGFGELVLGTTWVSHHGWHKKDATRGILVGTSDMHHGIGEGEIFGERGPSLEESRSVTAEADANCIL